MNEGVNRRKIDTSRISHTLTDFDSQVMLCCGEGGSMRKGKEGTDNSYSMWLFLTMRGVRENREEAKENQRKESFLAPSSRQWISLSLSESLCTTTGVETDVPHAGRELQDDEDFL